MAADEAVLLELADAVLEGLPFHWIAARAGAQDATRALIPHFQLVADIASVARPSSMSVAALAGGGPDQLPLPSTWGPLTVEGRIGSGAFGDVYRARDPRLDRPVALKLLRGPRDAAVTSAVVDEARLMARVRHPNVVTVFGAERVDGHVGLWMEFVDGQSLEEELKARGPLPPAEVVSIGIDLCGALEAIHRAGLLHRDLKTHNVLRDREGRVLVTDFGAGLDTTLTEAQHDLAGTPLYLAPEVLAGAPASPQSDIYGVGVLLFHLLTSAYPVTGRSLADVRHAHAARRRVGLAEIRPDLDTRTTEAIERALDDNRAKRYASAADMAAALAEARQDRASGAPRRLTQALAAVALVATVAVGAWWTFASDSIPTSPATPPGVQRVLLPASVPGVPSPDGRVLPYTDAAGKAQIWDLDSRQRVRLIRDNDDGVVYDVGPVVSPDGRSVVTTSLQSDDSWELRLISADGPPRRPLVARQRAYRPEVLDWSSDGRHVLCWFRQRNGSTDMVLVPISGGPPRIINTFHGTQPWSARLSPDGRHVAVVEGARDAGSPADLVVFDADDGAHRVVVRSIASFTAPAWTSDGAHLFFLRPSAETPGSRDGWVVPVANGAAAGEPVLAMANLGSVNWVRLSTSNVLSRVIGNRSAEVYTQPIDLRGGTSSAAPSRVAPGKMGNHVAPAWSADGRWLAYFTIRPAPAAGGLPLRTLTIKDLGTGESRETPTPLSFLGGYTPQWAPDSRSVVVWGSDDGTDGRLGYYRVTLPTGAATPVVIRGRADAANSQFSPSGLFLYRQPGRGVVARDLSTSRERVVGGAAGSGELWDFRLAPNGRSMAFTIVTRDGGGQSTRLEVQDVGEAPREIFRVKGREQMRVQAWTHDGAGILYTYADGERPLELFLIPATGGTPRGMGISFIRSGSNEPNGLTLSPDGRQIAYTERVVEYELWTEPLSLPRH